MLKNMVALQVSIFGLFIRQPADGRLLRGDYAINGAKCTLACVYARATGVTVSMMLDLTGEARQFKRHEHWRDITNPHLHSSPL